jgi:hypothetical protein
LDVPDPQGSFHRREFALRNGLILFETNNFVLIAAVAYFQSKVQLLSHLKLFSSSKR